MPTLRTAIALYDGVTAPLQHMTRAMDIVLNSFEAMQTASTHAVDVSAIRVAREELAQARVAFDSIENSIDRANNRQREFNQNLHSGGLAAGGLLSKLKNIALTVGGLAAAKQALNVSDKLTGARARLNLLTETPQNIGNDSAEINAQITDGGSLAVLEKKVMASAQRSRAAFFDTASAVAKLGSNAREAFGGNLDEVIAFTELVNKQFVIGGASAQERSAAMLQLTQAMGSGVLRGDELNSVFENAPGIIRNVADYLGVSVGEIRKLAKDGELTAETVKNAMFAAADEINGKFEGMPKTFGDIMTDISNKSLSAFSPVLGKLNETLNSDRFSGFTDGLVNGLAAVSSAAATVFDGLVDMGAFVSDHWGAIAPVIYTVAGALMFYHGVQLAANTVNAIATGITTAKTFAESVHAASLAMSSGATFTATAAQHGLNAALLACPLTWIVLAIGTVVAAIYVVVGMFNHFKNAAVSATGVVAGAFGAFCAQAINMFIIPLQNKIATFINFFTNVFNDLIAAIKVLFYDLAQTVIGYIQNIADAIEALINKIPGMQVDITSGLDHLYNRIEKASQTVKDASGWQEVVKRWDYIDLKSAAAAGYAFGENIENKIKGVFDFNARDAMGAGVPDYGNVMDGIAGNTSAIADNTAQTADAVKLSNEDLALLRSIAEREAINRFTTAEIKVEMINNNTISNEMDLDGIAYILEEKVSEKLAVAAEGVHI